MIFNGSFDPTEVWDEDEERNCKLVFIGKNLDPAELKRGFMGCVVTRASIQKKLKKLRFKVGEKVMAMVDENGWGECEVVAHMYHDENMQPGMVAPYQLKVVKTGDLIWAPVDDERCVRPVASL